MVRGTAETAQTNPPPAQLATAGSDSFSAMMETVLVRTSFATATRTVMMAQTKILCCVVSCVLLPVSIQSLFAKMSNVLWCLLLTFFNFKLCNFSHFCVSYFFTFEFVFPLATHQCETHQWQCANKRCIPESWQCDGEDDCGDQSDEAPTHCSTRICRPGQFKCRNGRCIPQSWKCDVDDDCGDNSDEPLEECSK